MTTHARAATGAAVVAAAMILAGCTTPSAPQQDSITIAATEFLQAGFDPFAGSRADLQDGGAAWDPLIMSGGLGTDPEPWLAESWEVSDDGRLVTFQLRQDVDFVDGTHFDAPGLEKYLEAYFAAGEAGEGALLFAQYGLDVAATDEYTIEFEFTKQVISDQWWFTFSWVPIASPATVGVEGAFDDGPVGTGPYLLVDQVPQVSNTFERNPDYWNPEAYPYDEVTITIFSDPIAALNAVRSGQADAALINSELAAAAEDEGLNVALGYGRTATLWILDHAGAIVPALADERVRQAMNMAFDRETILNELNNGYGYLGAQAFVEGQPGFVDGGDDRYGYDVEKARSLLVEAGYPDGFDLTILSYGGSLTFVNTIPLQPIVQDSLGEIGIDVTFETFSGELGPFITEMIRGGTFPVVMWQQSQQYIVPNMEDYWPPASTEPIKDLISQLRSSGPEDQDAAYEAIGELLLDEVWHIPFSRPAGVIVSSADVEVTTTGFHANPRLHQYRPVGDEYQPVE